MYSDIGALLQFALNQLITEGELMVSVRSNHIEDHEVEVGSRSQAISPRYQHR